MTSYKPAVSEGLRFLLVRRQMGSIHTQVHRLIKTRREKQLNLLARPDDGGRQETTVCVWTYTGPVLRYLISTDWGLMGASIFQQYAKQMRISGITGCQAASRATCDANL